MARIRTQVAKPFAQKVTEETKFLFCIFSVSSVTFCETALGFHPCNPWWLQTLKRNPDDSVL